MSRPSGTIYAAIVRGNRKELSRKIWLQGPSGKWDAPALEWLTIKDSDTKEKDKRDSNEKE